MKNNDDRHFSAFKADIRHLYVLFVFMILTLGVGVFLLTQSRSGDSLAASTIVDSGIQAGQYTSIAMAADGYARISYYQQNGGDLKFAQCTNADCSTNNLTVVDSTGDVGEYTSLAMADDGFARISYYDETNTDIKFVQCTNDACSTSVITTIDSMGDVGKDTAITMADDGFARISYYDETNTDIKFVQCTNDACSTNVITTVATNSLGYGTDIAMASDGYARITHYATSIYSYLQFIQCTNADCSTKNSTNIYPAAPGSGGIGSSVAMADDGYARITYHDDSAGGSVKFVQCTNDACSTNVLTDVEAQSYSPSAQTSLAMADDGYARIAYLDTDNVDVKFVQCTNDACSTNTISTVDSTGSVGWWPSLALGSDGFARISYYDSSNTDLKFFQCVDAACSNAAPTASSVTITGTAEVDQLLTGNYTYADTDGDSEGTSTFRWLRDDVAIDGATSSTYTTVEADGGTTIKFEVTPVAATGTSPGIAVESVGTAITANSAPTAPTTLYSNTAITTAQAGSANPTTLVNNDIVVSAINNDPDADAADKYEVQVATDNVFASIVYDSGSSGTSMTSTADGARSPDIGIPVSITAGTTYYWRIKFWDTNSAEGAWSPSAESAATFQTNASLATALTTIDSTGTVGQYTSTVVASDGFSRIAYYDTTNTDLKFAQCIDSTCTSPVITSVDSTGSVGQYTSIAMASDGFARISYYDQTNASLKFAQCTNAACSTSVITTVDNTATSAGTFTSIVMASDGFPRIGYYSYIAGGKFDPSYYQLKFAKCENASCSSKTLSVVDSSGSLQVGQYASLSMSASDGFPRFSYYDTTNTSLKFAQCTDATCTAPVLTTVDSTDTVGLYTSLTMASDGFARISYYDATNRDLKFAQCTDAACTSPVLTTVDSTGIVGTYTSLKMASDGFARIAYYDTTNTNLKFVKCTDAPCTSGSATFTSVASDGSVGTYASLALTSSGYPTISYYDATNLDLKLASCTNSVCTDAVENVIPTASSVSISGLAIEDGTLTGSYTYTDADGDVEGTSTFRWLRDDVAIDDATSSTYVLATDDVGTAIKFEVTPVADTGLTPGTAVASSVTSTVIPAPTMSFDIDTATTDTESATPYSVSLGTLSASTLTTSNSSINSIFLDLTSNAGNGSTITVMGSNGGLYSTTADNTITLATSEETVIAGQEKFGMCVASATQVSGTGTFTASSTYDANGASNCTILNGGTPTIGKINTTATSILSTDGTITTGRAQILLKASITGLTPAASDYTETLTFIATGEF
ncbi:MAG: hypothetical protein Q8P11_03930 [bacterium]|nr:hypothetical protein [bacterium]